MYLIVLLLYLQLKTIAMKTILSNLKIPVNEKTPVKDPETSAALGNKKIPEGFFFVYKEAISPLIEKVLKNKS